MRALLGLGCGLLFAGCASSVRVVTPCGADAAPSSSCPVDAQVAVNCGPNLYDFGSDAGGLLGYIWNGTACVARGGPLCEGACPGLYPSWAACQAAYATCLPEAGVDAGSMDATDGGSPVPDGFDAIDGSLAIAPPRLIAPLSTSTVAAARVTLRWALADGTDGVALALCRDRDLSVNCLSFDVSGTSFVPPFVLGPGVWFWGARGRSGATYSAVTSATWSMRVGQRSVSTGATWGSFYDANADGYPDLAVGATRENAEHVYFSSATGYVLDGTNAVTLQPLTETQMGASTSTTDVNGDGYSDLVLSGLGAVYVYRGDGGRFQPAGSVRPQLLVPPAGSARFGDSSAAVGDVNGDGYGDVAVTDSRPTDGVGRVYVFLGSATGIQTTFASASAHDTNVSGSNTLVVAAAGDVNGDGFADVVVGNAGNEHATVYFGSPVGLSDGSSVLLVHPDTAGSAGAPSFGTAVAGAGDVDGDGYPDVLVGAPLLDVAGVRRGRVYLYRGAAGTAFASTPSLVFEAPDPGASFGASLAGIGDVNRDGFSDVLVGGPTANTDSGRAYLFAGALALSVAPPAYTIDPPSLHGGFGAAMSALGDATSDGFEDFAIAGAALNGTGGVSVYFGGTTVPRTPAVTVSGSVSGGTFGSSVAQPVLHGVPGRS